MVINQEPRNAGPAKESRTTLRESKPAVATIPLWRGTRFSLASSRLTAPKRKRRQLAEREFLELPTPIHDRSPMISAMFR
jgi:hypothetical protein